MKLSRRDGIKTAQQEHVENIGSPNVHIESGANQIIQEAVELVKSKNPEALTNITDIIVHLDKPIYGEFNSSKEHSIFINFPKIEQEAKSKLQGQSEDKIKEAMVKAVASVIIHESTHQRRFTENNDTSEAPAEQAEKEFAERL